MAKPQSGKTGRPKDFEEEVGRITITLPKDTLKRLQYAAVEREVSRNVLINEAIQHYLKEGNA